jgi:predicted metal-dependent phosphoesterase TrpH
MSRIVRIDMHVHSSASPDSRLTLDEAVSQAKRVGLHGLAITDHNLLWGSPVPGRVVEVSGITILPGIEVSTREGHLLAYFVSQAPAPHQPLVDTLREVHAAGGLAILPHPYRLFHGAAHQLGSLRLPLEGVEVLNGHTSATRNRRAKEWAKERGLRFFGGSDAHAPQEVGSCYTEIAWSEDGWKATLHNGTTVLGGPGIGRGAMYAVGLGNFWKRLKRGFRPL